MTLTNTEILKAKSGKKPYKLFDGDGLFLLVNPSGSKIWRFKYYFAGKENQISFGKFDEVKLADAREKRLNARKLLSNGIDPSGKKREERQLAIYKSENTFEVIAKQWHETNISKWSEEHGKKLLNRLENHIFPHFGHRAIDSIKPLEVLGVLKKVEEKGKIETAHCLLQYCSAIFRYAIITGRTENNPAGNLSGALKPKKPEHYRTIKPSELKDFLEKLETVSTSLQNRIAVKLLLLTFLRTGELRKTKWEHIDFEAREWRVPAEIMKMKHPHIVPLSKQVIALLEELKKITGYSEYILLSRQQRKNPYISENTVNYVIQRMGYGKKVVGHGFRSLASTALNEHGFNKDAIERQLSHKEPNKIRAAYNQAEYMPERIKIMQWWADFIENKGVIKEADNVLTFSAKK